MNKRTLLLSAMSKKGWVTPTDIPASEAAALHDLYIKTNGASWINNTNWGKTNTAANWYGITLNDAKTNVSIISGQNNNLIGSLDGWNFNAFTKLEDFYFKNLTGLTGDITNWVMPASMENFQVYGSGVTGNIGSWDLSVITGHMTSMYLNNTALMGNISGWKLPAGLCNLLLHDTAVSGDISGWTLPNVIAPYTMSYQLHNTSLTGSMNTWVMPAQMQYFYVHGTSLTGVPSLASAVVLKEIAVLNCSLTQPNVDAWTLAIYNRWGAFTNTGLICHLEGNNSAPSGTYQDATPPTTGKEYIYKLKNDPDATGYTKWSIYYTA